MSVNKSRNQGVNVQSESDKSSSLSQGKVLDNGRCGKNNNDSSINKVKDELKAVIELMGPTTSNYESSIVGELLENSMYSNVSSHNRATRNNSKNKIKTNSEDQPATTDYDQSLVATDNFTMQDTDISVVDNPLPMESIPIQCICPPPVLPANYIYNSECMCPQMANYIHSYGIREKDKPEKPNILDTFLKSFKDKKTNTLAGNGEFYTINIQQSKKNDVPKRFVFELVDNSTKKMPLPNYGNENCVVTENLNSLPAYPSEKLKCLSENLAARSTKHDGITNEVLPIDSTNNAGIIKKKKFNLKTTYTDLDGATRVDVYYFDHGCSSYFRTTDRSPVIATEDLAERTEAYTTKFWAEIFGSFNIGFSFLISLILQFIRFFLYSILRPLTVGLIQLLSDYFFKPLLTTLFNALIQPVLIFLYNIVTSLRDICEPIAEAIGYFLREIAVLVKAFRIVEVTTEQARTTCFKKNSKKQRALYRAKNGAECFENI